MGDETRQFKKDIEQVIRDMAGEVTDVKVTQATICTKQDAMHNDVKKINGRLSTVENKTDSLESYRDKSVAAKKTTAKWVSGIMVAIGILIGVLKLVGCASPCAPGYHSLYDKPVVNPSMPKTKYYDPQIVGTFDDWESISGNKVTDVLYEADTNFIFLWSDTLLQQIHLGIWLDGWIIQSDTFFAPEYPATRTVEIFSTTKPGGGDWTLDDFNLTQGHISDTYNYFEQSYKFYRQPPPLGEWDIVSVGLRAVIQFGTDLDQIQIRVLKIEKVLNYFD